MITRILTDRADYNSSILEIRSAWLSDLLIYLGIDSDEVKKVPRDVMVEYFLHNNIEIIEFVDIGALKVSYEGEVVGEWAGPEFKMKEDENGKLYYEVAIEHWSVAEEEIDI